MKRSRNWKSIAGALRACALAAVAAVVLSGCSSDMEQRVDLLESENMDLRTRNGQLEKALAQTEGQRSLFDGELRALRAENDRLAELSRTPAAPTGQTFATGFEGIGGVTTSTRAGELVVDVPGDVLFASGKTSLKGEAKKTLDQIAEILNSSYAGHLIRIAGHTDGDPIRKSQWKTNERLSSERALAVEDYLASRGVEKDRMYAAAFGASNPKGSKKESRRVEIVILNTMTR